MINILILLSLFFFCPTFVQAQSGTPEVTPTPTQAITPTQVVTPSTQPTAVPTLKPGISITSLPSEANKEQSFGVTIQIINGKPSTDYFVKVYGGLSNSSDIQVLGSSWLNDYNGEWVSMPKFTSDSVGNVQCVIEARASSSGNTGNYEIKAKAKSVTTGEIIDNSNNKVIQINQSVSPTSQPTATTVPTATPYPTSPPTSTSAPTSTPTPTLTPTPTKIVTTPTVTPFDAGLVEPTDNVSKNDDYSVTMMSTDAQNENNNTNPMILGTSETTTSSSDKSGNNNILPIIFISLGGILLVSPIVITKIQNAKKKTE